MELSKLDGVFHEGITWFKLSNNFFEGMDKPMFLVGSTMNEGFFIRNVFGQIKKATYKYPASSIGQVATTTEGSPMTTQEDDNGSKETLALDKNNGEDGLEAVAELMGNLLLQEIKRGNNEDFNLFI